MRGTYVVLVLGEASSLRVSVRDPEGRPVEGARIRAHVGDAARGAVVEEAVSDAAGEATLDGLDPGSLELRVRASGRVPGTSRATFTGPGELQHRTVVLTTGLPLIVRVVEGAGDAPVAGAYVRLENRGLDLDEEAGRTDARGLLEIPAAGRAGDAVVVTASRDPLSAESANVTLSEPTAERPPTASLRLATTPSTEYSGDVVDLEGRPLSGAAIVFANMGALRGYAQAATSDPTGRFVLRAPGTRFPLAPERLGAISSEDGIAVGFLTAGTPGRLSLRGAGRVEGTIADEKGTRLEGAWIVLEPEGAAEAELGAFRADPRVRTLRMAVSDATGSWGCPGVPIGTYRVTASFGPDRATDLASVTVVAGGSERRELRADDRSHARGPGDLDGRGRARRGRRDGMAGTGRRSLRRHATYPCGRAGPVRTAGRQPRPLDRRGVGAGPRDGAGPERARTVPARRRAPDGARVRARRRRGSRRRPVRGGFRGARDGRGGRAPRRRRRRGRRRDAADVLGRGRHVPPRGAPGGPPPGGRPYALRAPHRTSDRGRRAGRRGGPAPAAAAAARGHDPRGLARRGRRPPSPGRVGRGAARRLLRGRHARRAVHGDPRRGRAVVGLRARHRDVARDREGAPRPVRGGPPADRVGPGRRVSPRGHRRRAASSCG